MSRSAFMKAAVGLMAGALVTGCAKNSGFTKNLDLEVVVKGNDPANVKAEKLAKASEALLSAQGFAYASDIADLALQIDGSNLRAQFVKATLAPIMPMKGIMERVAPVAQENKRTARDYQEQVSKMRDEMSDTTLKSFLFDGKADMKSESDVQAHLDQVAGGFETLRRFARDNKDKELTVMPTDALYKAMQDRSTACKIEKSSGLSFEIDCPTPAKELVVTLGRADFEMIQQFAAGLELYTALLNSYDLSGSLKVADAHPPESGEPKAEQVINELLANPKFGQLRMRNGFRLVKELGPDAVSGLRWIMANQQTLCPKGDTSAANRPGNLIDHGICLTARQKAELPAELDKAESILNGATVTMKLDNEETYKITPMALVYTPVGNLRSLTPLKFNECDQVSEVSNPTLNGFFVEKDLNFVLKGQKRCAN